MLDFTNWFLKFVKDMILAIVSIQSTDGYSLGNMIVGSTIVGVIIAGTIGSVAIVTRRINRDDDRLHR